MTLQNCDALSGKFEKIGGFCPLIFLGGILNITG